jgi:hypothetical protein
MSLVQIISHFGRKTKVKDAAITVYGGVVCLSQLKVVR